MKKDVPCNNCITKSICRNDFINDYTNILSKCQLVTEYIVTEEDNYISEECVVEVCDVLGIDIHDRSTILTHIAFDDNLRMFNLYDRY